MPLVFRLARVLPFRIPKPEMNVVCELPPPTVAFAVLDKVAPPEAETQFCSLVWKLFPDEVDTEAYELARRNCADETAEKDKSAREVPNNRMVIEAKYNKPLQV
jgi:hypothetical protein